GARPGGRVFREPLGRPLASGLLFGSRGGGGTVEVSLVNDALEFEYLSEKEAAMH
ncbi:Clp protease, partial [Vibrio sp. 1762]|nr:Clp protease [Vibrio sp. 1762]